MTVARSLRSYQLNIKSVILKLAVSASYEAELVCVYHLIHVFQLEQEDRNMYQYMDKILEQF